MAKLVDAPSSGGGAVRCAGSNPVPGTKKPLSTDKGFYLSLFLFVIKLPARFILSSNILIGKDSP